MFVVRRGLAKERQGHIREDQNNQGSNGETKRKEVCDDCVDKIALASCAVSCSVDNDNGDTTATSLMTKCPMPYASHTGVSSSPRDPLLTPTMPYLSIEGTLTIVLLEDVDSHREDERKNCEDDQQD